MTKQEIALQLTLKALDEKMIASSGGDSCIEINHSAAKEITEFYNYIYENIYKASTISFD